VLTAQRLSLNERVWWSLMRAIERSCSKLKSNPLSIRKPHAMSI
jgi:hypothetical protein